MLRQPDGDQRGGSSSLLSVAGVAKRCGVSTRTVYRWMDSDGLPVHRIPGAGARPILRIDAGDLDRWLGQYRHSFAEKHAAADQVIRLEGRRFITAGSPPTRTGDGLDTRAARASRVPAHEEAGR